MVEKGKAVEGGELMGAAVERSRRNLELDAGDDIDLFLCYRILT